MYIVSQEQDKVMQDVFSQALDEEKWKVDSKRRVLESITLLVYHFKKVREECRMLSTGSGFFDLYKLFQKYLEKYGNTLKSKLKQLESKSDDNSIRVMCAILNTSHFCRSTTEDVEVGLKQDIDERFKEQVTLKSTIDLFDSISQLCVDGLIAKVIVKLEGAFKSLTDMDWGNITAVRDQSPFVTMIQADLNVITPIFSELIVPSHYGPLCCPLIIQIVTVVQESVKKIRGISELGSEQLLCDVKILKTVLSKIIGPEDKWVAKRLDQTIVVLEKLCQILLSPPENLVSTYKSLFANHTPEQLLEFLDIKGIKLVEQESFLDTYGLSKNSPLRQAIRDAISEQDSAYRKIGSFFDPMGQFIK